MSFWTGRPKQVAGEYKSPDFCRLRWLIDQHCHLMVIKGSTRHLRERGRGYWRHCACLCVKIVQRKSIWITSLVQFQLFVYCMYYLCICMYVVMRSVLRWELAYRITLCDFIMTIENLECWMTNVALISLHKSLLEYAEGVTISEEEHCIAQVCTFFRSKLIFGSFVSIPSQQSFANCKELSWYFVS